VVEEECSPKQGKKEELATTRSTLPGDSTGLCGGSSCAAAAASTVPQRTRRYLPTRR